MAHYPAVNAVRKIGILGGGTIGASWSAFFLSEGMMWSLGTRHRMRKPSCGLL